MGICYFNSTSKISPTCQYLNRTRICLGNGRHTVLSIHIIMALRLPLFSLTGFLSILKSRQVRNEAKPVCLWNEFSDVVLVIVYNYPFYSSIPALTALYKNAFPTMMFCGPREAKNVSYTVEALHIHKGYFAYTCMTRAMEKHPGYSGYLLINDDVMLNYWNLVGLKRDVIWEGPKEPIHFQNYSQPERWYWWNSTWGMKTCQKAFNEIWAMRESNLDEWQPELIDKHTDEQTFLRTTVWNTKMALDVLQKKRKWDVVLLSWPLRCVLYSWKIRVFI